MSGIYLTTVVAAIVVYIAVVALAGPHPDTVGRWVYMILIGVVVAALATGVVAILVQLRKKKLPAVQIQEVGKERKPNGNG